MKFDELLQTSQFLMGCMKAGAKLAPILAKRDRAMFVRHSKGAGGDISIGADLLCEEEFGEALLGIANLDSEEGGLIKCRGESSDIIVLDPLDGSDNYLSNIPYYGASLALCDKDGNVKEACIMNFCSGEVFYDRVESKRDCKPSNAQNSLDEISPPYTKLHLFREEILRPKSIADDKNTPPLQPPKCGIFERAYCNPSVVAKLHNHKVKFRSLGAGALSWAYCLEGRFLLLGGKSRRYDAKAGQFLARDLHIREIVDKNGAFFLLVSKYKEIFDMISGIVLD